MAKQLPKQVQSAVAWIKGNTLVVAFCAIIIAVPVVSYFAADWFGQGIRSEAEKKAKAYASVTSALNTKVDLPIPGGDPVPLDGLPTQQTVAEFGELLKGAERNADAVYATAQSHNTNGGTDVAGKSRHPTIVPDAVFPNYPKNFGDASKVRANFVKALNAKYQELLKQVNAGSPPDGSVLRTSIQTEQDRFLLDRGGIPIEKLTSDDRKALENRLAQARLIGCNEVAKGISFYADLNAFSVPSEEDPAILGLFKDMKDVASQDRLLFDLQWQYWIASDVVNAFAAANGKGGAVTTDPVKRLVRLSILPMQAMAAGSASTETNAVMAEDSIPTEEVPLEDGSAPVTSQPGVAIDAPLGKPVVDTSIDAPRDFSKSLTGRVSNPVYDVRLAEVTFIAETGKLPQVFDKLARENFMTITNVRLTPADVFDAARMGYLYGVQPVSEVTATLETVWFRDWTSVLMPAAVRTALGIQSATPGSEPASDTTTEAQGS
jgi:hypothetical protein